MSTRRRTSAVLVSLLLAATAAAQTLPSQSRTLQVLRDVYTATYDSAIPWVNSTGWADTTNTNYCAWFGVTCSPVDGYTVTGLALKQNSMRGELPSTIGELTGLTTLDISENTLSYDVASLEPLVNVRNLILGSRLQGDPCTFPYSGPAMFDCKGFPDFGAMFIAYNPVARPIPRGNATRMLAAFHGLTQLTMSGQSIDLVLSQENFCKHVNLTYVDFSAMPLMVGAIPDCVSALIKLRTFSFSATGIQRLSENISTMPSLIRLSASNTMLTGPYFSRLPPNMFLFAMASNPGLRGDPPRANQYVSINDVSIANSLENYYILYNYGTDGVFPRDLEQAKNLKVLYLGYTSVTGVLPAFNWPQIILIFITGTRMTGPLPDIFDSARTVVTNAMLPFPFCTPGCPVPILAPIAIPLGLTNFYAADIPLGNVPPSLLRHPSVSILLMGNSSLTDDIATLISPSTFLPSLTQLALNGNRITGDLSSTTICTNLKKLQQLFLDNNQISGTIPSCIGKSAFNLTLLYLNNNQLSGPIPIGLTTMTTLGVLDLSWNRLQGKIPTTIDRMAGLRTLNLAHNQLSGLIADDLWSLCTVQLLTSIDLSFNDYYGPILSYAWSSTVAAAPQFTSLVSLNLASNRISGAFPEILRTKRSSITYLNLESNLMQSPLPDFSMLNVLLIANNSFTDAGALPYYLERSPYLVETADGTYQCPVIEGSVRQMVVTIDPTYYGYRYCRCSPGYFGSPPACRPCLAHGVCNGRADSAMVVPAGYYPSPNASNPTHLVKCLDNPVRSEPSFCNPDEHGNFTCSTGYEGRLCSKCVEGYYHRQSQCVKCPPAAVAIVTFVVLLVLLAAVAAAMRFLPYGKEELMVVLKVAILYIQVANAIVTKAGLRWPTAMMGLNRAFDVFAVDISYFSCFGSKAYIDLGLTAEVQGLVVLGVVGIIALVFLFFLFDLLSWVDEHATKERATPATPKLTPRQMVKEDGTPIETHEWHDREFETAIEAFDNSRSIFETSDPTVAKARRKFMLVRAGFMLVKFLYLPVAVNILQVFQCDEDPADGHKYMHFSPAQPCELSNSKYARNFAIAIVLIPIYIVAYPIFVLVSSMMFRNDRRLVVNVWYFLFQEFRRVKAPYLLWHVVRQLLLSIFLIVVPSRTTLPLLVILTTAMLVVHIWQWPYRMLIQNFLEGVAIAGAHVLLLLGMASSTVQEIDETLCAALIMLVNVTVFVLSFYGAAMHIKFRDIERRHCKWPLARFILPVKPWTETVDMKDTVGSPSLENLEMDQSQSMSAEPASKAYVITTPTNAETPEGAIPVRRASALPHTPAPEGEPTPEEEW